MGQILSSFWSLWFPSREYKICMVREIAEAHCWDPGSGGQSCTDAFEILLCRWGWTTLGRPQFCTRQANPYALHSSAVEQCALLCAGAGRMQGWRHNNNSVHLPQPTARCTFLLQLHLKETVKTQPTIGSNVEQIKFENLTFEASHPPASG